jgi:hypothetical protein
MSLNQILKTLGSGQVLNVVNLLQTLVHAVIEEIETLRQNHTNTVASQSDQINRLEDRTGQAISGTCDQLTAKMETAVRDLNSRLIALDTKVLSELEACVTNTVEEIGLVQERLDARIDGLQATVKTHVERLEAAIAHLALIGSTPAKLEGYGEPSKE